MPPSEARDLLRQIQAGAIAPIYFLYGRERYLIDRVVAALRKAVLAGPMGDLNLQVLDAGNDSGSPPAILAAARTMPMLAKMRLVIVKDADELDAEALEALTPYAGKPSPTTCLVFLAGKADTRRRFFLAVKKTGVVEKLDPIYESRMPGWVTAEGRGRGLRFEPGAAELLVAVVGNDLARLSSVLDQLQLYLADSSEVTAAAIEELVADTRQHSIFDLANAVGERDLDRALGVVAGMARARESSVGAVAMLARHFRQLARLRELGHRPKEELASTVGVHPYFLDGLLAQARRFDQGELRRVFEALYRADRQLKSSRVDDRIVLEQLVMRLCRRQGQGQGSASGPAQGSEQGQGSAARRV